VMFSFLVVEAYTGTLPCMQMALPSLDGTSSTSSNPEVETAMFEAARGRTGLVAAPVARARIA
jgi:hypothetical protein